MRWLSLFAFLMTAACGGGGAVQDPDMMGPGDPGDPSNPGGPGDPDGLPLTGRANYNGQLTLGLERAGNPAGQRDAISSAVTVDVDFGATDAQVTGAARAFAGFDGALFLTLGVIDRDATSGAPDYAGSFSGTIKEGTDSYLVFGQFDGAFSGAGQDAVSGRITANARNGNSQTVVDGSYQAGRVP